MPETPADSENQSQRRRSTAGLVGMGALVATLAGCLLWIWMLSAPWRLASGLLEAGDHLKRAEKKLSKTALKDAQFEVFAGLAGAARAQHGIDGPQPLFDLARLVPQARRALAESNHLVSAAVHSSLAARGTLKIGINALRGPSRIIVPEDDEEKGAGSVVRLNRVVDVGATITAIRRHLQAVQDDLEAVAVANLPRRARGRVEDALERARDAEVVVADAEAGFALLPAILGADEKRWYLIGMQNSAEQRGTGGAILRYSYVSIEDGDSTIRKGESVYDIDRERRLLDIPLPKDAWHVRGIEDAHRFGNANWSPDWPLSARIMLDYAYEAGRTVPGTPPIPRFDGVIALDPNVMELLLPGTGDFRTSRFGHIIQPGGAVHFLLYKAYASHPLSSSRRAALRSVVQDFVARVFDPTHPTDLVTGLGKALREKHMMIWMKNPSEEQFIKRMGWDGAIREAKGGDYFYLVGQNVGGNKFDYYADQKTDLDIRIDGSDALVKASTSIYNGTFFPQTKHVLGDSGKRTVGGGRRTPLHESMLNLYVRPEARLIQAKAASGRECAAEVAVVTRACRMDTPEPAVWNGQSPPEHRERGKKVWSATLAIPPEMSGNLSFRYRVPSVVTEDEGRQVYRLVVQHQPRIRPEELSIHLSLPSGATDVVASGWERNGTELELTRTLEEDMVLEVSWR